MKYIKKWISDDAIDSSKLDQTDIYEFSGSIKATSNPIDDNDAINKENLEKLNRLGSTEYLSYEDIANKTIELNLVAKNPSNSNLCPIRGNNQKYGVDFTIRTSDDNKSYLCLSPVSTCPVGNFVDGENPTTGLTSVIGVGDRIQISYYYQ